jgi:hypothetical protein
MRNEDTLPRLLMISAMFALIIMALLFDFAITALQVQNSTGAGLEPVLVMLFPLFELLLVFGGMGIFWYLFASGERSKLVTTLFLVVGLLIVFGTPLLFFLPVPMAFYGLVQYIQPGTYVFQVGAMLTVIGILSILLKPHPSAEQSGELPEAEGPGEAAAS